jgi:hypothetical protein
VSIRVLRPGGVEGVGASCVAKASCGISGEGLSMLQVGCDRAPGRPAVPGSCGELAEVVGDLRQVPDQCQGLLASSGHRQGSRSGQRSRRRFNRSVDCKFHDYVSQSEFSSGRCTTSELAFRLFDTPRRILLGATVLTN